jgi:hypothetical protein
VPTVAAIANAIYDAVGIRMTELPMTPDKILRALREQAGQATGGREGKGEESGASRGC